MEEGQNPLSGSVSFGLDPNPDPLLYNERLAPDLYEIIRIQNHCSS